MEVAFGNLVRFLEIRNRKKIRTMKNGLSASRQKGRGSDFRDIRKYEFGDDNRLIDWNVTSRTGELHVREYYDELELNVNVFLDVSSSMNLSGQLPSSRYFYGYQFALLLALVFSRRSDRFRLLLFDDQLRYHTPQLRTEPAVYGEFSRLTKNVYSVKTDYNIPFSVLRERFPRQSITYIISDFHDFPDMSNYKSMKKQHEIYGVRILDGLATVPFELADFFMADAEGGGQRVAGQTGTEADRFFDSVLNLDPLETSGIMEFFQ